MARRKNMTARDILGSAQETAAKLQYDAGLDHWSRISSGLQQQADDFGNYLNSDNYTTADTDKYRSSANKAVEDLTAEMGRYGKSTQEYKTLDSYRQYYQNSLDTFDRLDVGTKMQDYINDYDTWRSQEDYNLQKQSLQDSLAALDAEMEKIEDKNSADYKSLQSYRDWYASYEEGLNRRADWDKRFTDADDFAAYDNSTNYKHVADVRRTIKEKQDELKALDPSLEKATAQDIDQRIKMLQRQMSGLQLYGSPADVQNAQTQLAALQQAKDTIGNLDAMRTELGRLERYGGENILRNYGGAYDPNFNYEAKLDELRVALGKAEEGSDKYEEISAQIRALAGPNGDGTNANGLYDENTWYGRYVMENFDVEAAQKRIDEIDKELEDLGLPKDRWLGQFIAGGQLSEGEVGYNPDGTVEVGAESDPHVMELRREKTELTQKMNSSERQQGRSKIETANAELPEVDGAYGKGNIDLTKRNTGLKDADGNLMTVKSMSFEEDGKEILIPTVVKKNGKWVELSEDEAIDWYHKTGEYLGKFDSVEEADKYAEALHRQQEDMYVNGKTKTGVSKSTLIEAGKGQIDATGKFYSSEEGTKSLGVLRDLTKEFGDTETDQYYAARAQEILDMVYAAIGAEKLGVDIGYTAEEALKAYEAQINDIAGYRRAAEVNRTESDFVRWNRQVFGQGGLVGGAISNIQNLPDMFTDEYRPESRTQSMIAHTGEMMGDQYDKLVLPGGKNLAQTIHEAAVTTGNMLPGMALSAAVTALAGPAGLGLQATQAAIAGKIAGAFEMGLTSGGQSYQQMLGMGYDAADARAYGVAMGAAEVGTQYFLGGISKLGGVSEEALLNLTKRIGNGILRAAAETTIHDVSEISEELLQNRIEGYLQYSLFDQGNAPKFFEMTEDDWYTVVVTALSTTAMEGPGVAIDSYRTNQLGLLASGQKSYSEAKTKGLMSAKLNKQEKARRALASEIGKAMQSDEALSYTLKTIGSSMDEGTNARELADLMEAGKIPSNARNLGELFGAILSETTTEDGKHLDFDKFMAKTIGGAIKFNEIERAEQAEGDTEKALNDAGQTLEEVMKNNPGAAVLNKTASTLSTQYGADPVKSVETAAVINKIRDGTAISSREMEQITGNSAEAKAARAYLAQQAGGENISVTADAAVTEAMVNELIKTNREQKKLIAEQTKAEVLAAATEAGDAAVVNRAAAGAVTKITAEDVKALQGAKRGVQEAERAAEIAKTRKQTANDMSFEQMAEQAGTAEGMILGAADAQMVKDLQAENAELQKTVDELSAVKMPSRAQASQLSASRQQMAENNARIETIMRTAADEIQKRRAEAGSEQATEKTEEPSKKGKKGIPPKQRKGEETVTLPSGNTMTRSEFNGTDEEWNNMVAQSGGSVMEESNEQTTDNDQGRNALGGQRDGAADQERGDRPEQGSDAGGDRSRRKLSTFDGSREVEINEEVDSDATVTRNDDISGLEESHPGIREFTDSLMSTGFKRITYVSNGNIYNVEGEAVPGFYNNGELFLSLDPHPGWAGYEATAEHEKLHLKLDFFRQRFGAEEADNFISSSLQNILGEASYIDAFRKYWKRYSPVYLRSNDTQTVAHMVNEEMLCDMIGGIDNFDANLGFYQDSLQDILDASNFNSVADALANRPDENPGTVTTEELDPGAMPHNVPVDTLISGENVDTPSTGIASIQSTSRLALYGFTRALGLSIDGENKVYYKTPEEAKARINSFTEVSKSDVENSPLGELIEYAKDKGYISEESMQRQFQLFADIGTISEKTADLYSAMQFYGSVLFTAMKLNSDKQYGLSEDIANICTKTQSMIDGMSEEMKRVKRGLSDDEILQIYQRNVANGLPVNCPECYVFSRWIGIGGLLDNIYRYQEKFSKMSVEEVAKEYDELFDEVITKFKNDRQAFIDKAVANGMSLEDAEAEAKKKFSKGKSRSKLVKETEKRYNDLLEKREELQAQGKDLSPKEAAELEEKEGKALSLRALVWINNVYFGGKDDHSAKNVNPRFAVPSDILFDLNAGEEFALHYPEAWAFRTTQGAGYGKAIVPTAEANLGESILVTGDAGYMKRKADAARKYEGDSTDERHRVADQFNIFLNQRGRIIDGKNKKGTRDNVLNRTTKKGLNQLFLGGQRLQSTSDSRFDTAIDTLMIMTELQAMHAGAQIYTKVLGAVPFYDAVAGFVNMSAMPFGGGLDKDGNPIDTPTGGVDMRQAIELRKQCPRAGTITIGVNDAHIRAMFKQVFRDFIIPYHASGGKIAIVAEMRRIQEGIAAGKYKMPQSTDYTLTQTDKFLSDTILKNDLHYTQAQIDEIHRYRDMRIWLLTGGKKGKEHMDLTRTDAPNLMPAQENARRIFQQLYISTRQPEGKWYGLSLGKGIIEGQIFPNEFWDTTATYDGRNNTPHSGVNTQRYLDYCEALGVLHRFSGKGVKTGKAPTVDGSMVMRGHIYNVDGRDPTGAKVPLTDLAYQVDEKGNYLLNEYGERIIEPYFWKTLTDRRMYGNEGEYLEQGAVTLDGLLDLGNPNAEEAVAESAETFASKEKGFAHPTGEVRYDHKKSMKLASEPLPGNQSRNSIQGEAKSAKQSPVTSKDLGDTAYTGPKMTTAEWRKAVAEDADIYTPEMENRWGLDAFDMREMDLAMVELLDAIDDIEKKHYWSTNTFPDLKGWYDYTDFLRQLNTPDSDRLNLAKKKIQFMIRNLDERYLDKMKYYPVQEYNTEQRAALRKIINQYKKIVDAQIEAVKLNKGIGKSLQIDSRKQYKLADIRSMFEELNSNEELTALGKKVFDWAELMERNGHRIPFKFKTIPDTNTSRTGGEEFGGKVNYNTKYFNDPGTSNQEKAETLLHEVIHVYTEYAVDAVQLYEGLAHPWQRYKDGQALKNLYDSLPLHVVQAVHTLEDINKQIKYDPLFADPSRRSGRMYGTENVNEMLAELSNPKFREALKKKSLLQRILDAVKKLFGITPSNALDAVSAAFDKLMLASYDDNIQFLNESFLRYSDQYSKFSQTPAKNTAVIPAKNAPKNQSRNSIQNEAPALKPAGENTTIYIKDGHRSDGSTVDFINEILDGNKKYETRNHNRLTRKWVGMAKDGKVYGRVKLGDPIVLRKGTKAYRESMIEGTEYDLKDGETKYAYPIEAVEDYRDNPKPVTKNGNYGRFSIQGEPATAQQAQTYYSQQDTKVNEWAPEFYSKMQRTIEDWTGGNGKPMGAKMAANQVLSWLKGKGVKAEEIKWSGIVPYLEGKKTVTKDELLQVMAENEIKIETKVLGGGGYSVSTYGSALVRHYPTYKGVRARLKDIADAEGISVDQLKMNRLGRDSAITSVTRADTGEWVADIFDDSEERPLWGGFVVSKEGENYREILFKNPELLYKNQASNTHWKKDASGTLAHARVNDLLSRDGKEILMVEEIQSDLHNALAKNGGRLLEGEEAEMRDLYQERNAIGSFYTREDSERYYELFQKKLQPFADARAAAQKKVQSLIPDNLAETYGRIENALNDAGFTDYNAQWWLGGTIQSPLTWNIMDEDAFQPSQEEYDEAERIAYEVLNEEEKKYLEAGREYKQRQDDFQKETDRLQETPPDVPFAGSSDTYHEYVMKHLLRLAAEGGYDRLAWTTAQQQSDRWSDEYAEGYRIEYDQNIPKFMNKYVKQWGGKVGTTTLDNGDEVWSVDITPEMRDSVLTKGQPLFGSKFSIQDSTPSTSRYAESQLDKDILDVLQTEGSEGLTAWVNEQKAKHEDALENAKIKTPSIPSKGFVPPVSAKERALQRSTLEALINRYGTMKPSEKSNGFVLPPKNQKGQPLRRHIQNVLSSENISDEARDHGLRFTLTNANATFVPDSNDALIKDAVADIKDMGLEHALTTFKHNASKVNLGTKGILQNIALGEQLLLETSSNGDMANFIDVLSSVCELGTTIGKSLQAFRLLKQSGPIGQLYYVQKAVDRMNKQNEERMKRKGEFKEIVVKDDLAKAVINAKTEEDRDAAMKALIADIASQAPVTLRDRWNAWRYLAMLGNARTHVRNIVGNAFFAPMRYVKDVMAAGGEFLATKAGWMEEEDRTKALSVSRELRDFALSDADIMQKELQGNGKYNPTQEILKARRLLPGFLDALSRKNGDLLEMEDWWFLKGAYARALAMQLSHMGYSTEELTTTTEGQEALNRARKTAILEAQKATYRDFVAAASWLNRGKHLTGAAGTILSIGLEGVLPFTKTPINILRRGIEYSPLGIAKGIGTILSGVKNGNLDVAEAIDQLAAGLTGTGVAVLGLLLARMGVLRGKKGDDDEENFDKMQGMQDYSLQLGDQSFTIDWAAPTALPLFTGAAVAQLLEESGEDGLQAKDIWNGIMMIAEPMTSLSMLDGLNKLIESTAYASGNEKIATIATQAATSYLGQAFPTILGQVARSIDGTRRSTYVDKNSPIPAAAQRFVQSSVQAKIPGWENAKVPYIDAWGRQSEPSSKVLNGIENFFAPWYRNTKQVTDVDEELKDLYSKTKADILPGAPQKYFSVGGEKKYLTADEWVSYATDVGQTKYDLMTQLISDPRYLALDDTKKAKVIKDYIYKYAGAVGKFHVDPNYDIHGTGVWIEEAEAAATDYERFERIWQQIEKTLKD